MLAVESPESLSAVSAYEGSALVEQITQAVGGYFSDWRKAPRTVLVFDDLHWADDASLELLVSLAALCREAALLIICLQRPDKEALSWRALNRSGRNWARRGSSSSSSHCLPAVRKSYSRTCCRSEICPTSCTI